MNEEGFVEVYNPGVNTFIEVPVYNAVSALNKAGVFTRSSGFHTRYHDANDNISPRWAIIVGGKIPVWLKTILLKHGFEYEEKKPKEVTYQRWLYTCIYLSKKVTGERNFRKAKKLFNEFAQEINRKAKSFHKSIVGIKK